MLDIHSMLSRGYFPRELPPPFSSESYAWVVATNIRRIPQTFSSRRRISKLCCHNTARVGLQRRILSIPNPIGQYNLTTTIVNHWNEIVSFVNRSNLSKSIPTVRGVHGRSVVPSHPQRDLVTHRAYIRAKSKYVLQADIASFYPSIYTHSIAWAAHTKAFAKAHRREYKYYGNSLDSWIQNSQDGQTVGIPIGPDSSLVISELILTAADVTLSNQVNGSRCFRFVDDYEFGCTSYAEAEQILSRLQQVLDEYELELNPVKTKIIELPTSLDSSWVYELRNFEFRGSNYEQRTDLIAYFDRAFVLAKQNPADHVLKYAIQRLQNVQIDQSNWQLAEQLHLQCVMNETETFLPVLGRLIDRHKAGFPIDKKTIGEVINSQIITQCPVSHGSEVCWAIWAAIFWDIQIESDAAKLLSKMNDSLVALLALDAHRRGLIPNGLDTTNWETYLTTDELYGEQWLLSYEANKKGWLPSKNGGDHVTADPNFAFLKSNNVAFYDLNKVMAVPTGASLSLGHYPIFNFEPESNKTKKNSIEPQTLNEPK
jgi:hypothetical protein